MSQSSTAMLSRNKPFSHWLHKNRYYHDQVISFYRSIIQPGARIFQVNCANGYLLDALKPAYVVGIESDNTMLQEARDLKPDFLFYATLDEVQAEQFDYLVVSCATMQTDDIIDLFNSLHRMCHERTRLIVDWYSWLWRPLVAIASMSGMCRTTTYRHWISMSEMKHLLQLANFDLITYGRYQVMPVRIPFLSSFVNAIDQLPLVNRFCLHQWIMARPMPVAVNDDKNKPSVTVLIPCRNEAGNIQTAFEQCPIMGSSTEILLVEGNSTDGTYERAQELAPRYPHKNIRVLKQPAKGKNDAVQFGFEHATGDILMILDGDLPVPPAQLSKFYDALVSGKGDFINGSRLVYSMQSGAMQFCNWIANNGFGVLLSYIMGQKVKDTLCGTKVMWKKDYRAMKQLFTTKDPFGDFNLLFSAAQLHLKIIDLPIRYYSRTYGATNIRRWKHGVILLYVCLCMMVRIKVRTSKRKG